jgi:hypothetical protein
MRHPRNATTAPASVKAAAALLLAYGTAVLVNATVVQSSGGWAASRIVPWALVQLIVAGLIAWGLVRQAPWAWWLGIAFSALWLALGAISVLVLEHRDIYWLPPSGFQLLFMGSLLALGVALALLASGSARRAFRAPVG